MSLSANGRALLKAHEQLRLKAYPDGGGVATIGWGHTSGVKLGQTITVAQAEKFLEEDLQTVYAGLGAITVPLNQNQFDALVDFVFNVGAYRFHHSTMLSKLNAGDFAGASKEFARWVYDNGQIVNGLVVRRKDEMDLFLSLDTRND